MRFDYLLFFVEKEVALSQLEVECSRRPYLDGKFFTVNKETSSLDGTIHARCNFCKPDKYFKVSLSNQTNPIQHLKTVHPDEYIKYRKYAQSKNKSRKRQPRTFLPATFKVNVMNYILENMMPSNTVESKSFRKIFDDLNIKNLEHMTQDSLSRMIMQTFKKNIEDIRKTVAKIGYVCATVDAWSGNNGRFLGVTLHWIDEKTFERRSAVIACKRFPGQHSRDAIEIHYSYNLTPEKINPTAINNGSNFVKDFKERGVDALDGLFCAAKVDVKGNAKTHILEDFSSHDPDSEDANFLKQCQRFPQHSRCASYTLHEVANTDIIKVIEQSADLKNSHSRVIAKCESLWESLRSPKMNETLRNYLGSELFKPMETSWKSLFDALELLVNLKEKLLLCSRGNVPGITVTDAFTESDFGYLEEYVMSTKCLAKAIDQLQNETHCYYGYLFPELVNLRKKLRRLQQDNARITICKPLIVGIIESLETRFKNIFEVSEEGISAAIAAVSHPIFKIDWLKCLSSSKVVHDHVVNAVSARIRSNILSNLNEFDFSDDPPTDQDPIIRSEANDQVTRYLKDTDKKLKMLEKYPEMLKLFCEFNTPLLSPAPGEHIFRHATKMVLPQFNLLSDCSFEQRVLRAANASKY